MTVAERTKAMIQDILVNHLPRIKEGLEKGYVDENQILVMYDHAVRVRILQECEMDNSMPGMHGAGCSLDEHEDALSRIDTELAAQAEEFEAHVPGLPPIKFKPTAHPLAVMAETEMTVKEAKGKFVGKQKAVRGERKDAAMLDEANFHRAHVEKLECICGGLIHDDPQFTGDVFLECGSCGRTFITEFELAEARKTETKKATKCPDATYFTTGTLAGGTDPVPMETEISLNGRKTTIKAKNGKFTLTYEEIVRMAVNQRRDPLNAFTGSDADLPHETVTYGHRVPFKDLPGERDGSLWKGKAVECTPGMCITCIGTGSA